MIETTLMCKKCQKYDIDEGDIVQSTHLDCGGDIEEVCTYCLGTGELVTDEQVYPGEPIYAPIGTRECICVKQRRIDSEVDNAVDTWKGL